MTTYLLLLMHPDDIKSPRSLKNNSIYTIIIIRILFLHVNIHQDVHVNVVHAYTDIKITIDSYSLFLYLFNNPRQLSDNTWRSQRPTLFLIRDISRFSHNSRSKDRPQLKIPQTTSRGNSGKYISNTSTSFISAWCPDNIRFLTQNNILLTFN